MKRKRNILEAIGAFVMGKGFYLVVLLCVAAIALSGYYLIRSVGNSLSSGEDEPVSATVNGEDAVTTPDPVPLQSVRDPEPEVTDTQEPDPQPSPQTSTQPEPSPQPSADPAYVPLVFTWPVKGAVLTDHSVEALSYDVTMGDWRTHDGVDIAAALGTRVLATAAGTVTARYVDDLMGTTVVIDHGEGLVSVYANLTDTPAVEVGDAVSTGTVIGAVGITAGSESGLEPHLHFSMLQNGKPIDPLDYLPKR